MVRRYGSEIQAMRPALPMFATLRCFLDSRLQFLIEGGESNGGFFRIPNDRRRTNDGQIDEKRLKTGMEKLNKLIRHLYAGMI